MTRWLVTGAAGQLGSRLMHRLRSDDAIGLTRADLDITSAADVSAAIDTHRPDVIVNAAAYTAVDAAESDESTAYAINATAAGHLAQAAARAGARMIHVSTDYVFAGDADRPYEVDDPTGPRTAYGRTKLAGEELALAHGATVVRTAWVWGGPGPNFVDTILRLARERDTLDVVNDQFGSPTYVVDLADALVSLGTSDVRAPVLHYANSGVASWYDLAREALAAAGQDPERIRPVDSTAFVRPAPRPAWSVLSTASWITHDLPAPPAWTDAVHARQRS